MAETRLKGAATRLSKHTAPTQPEEPSTPSRSKRRAAMKAKSLRMRESDEARLKAALDAVSEAAGVRIKESELLRGMIQQLSETNPKKMLEYIRKSIF